MSALRAPRASFLAIVVPGMLSSFVVACGSPPPKPPAPPPVPVATAPKEVPPDMSPVPEPPGLVALGRVNKPNAIVSAVGSWTRLPLPAGAALVAAVTEESIAEVVDLSQPIDAVVTMTTSRRGVDPQGAISVAVKSYDQAKEKLGAAHRLVAGENGQFRIEGLTLGRKGSASTFDPSNGEEPAGDEDGCVLAPAVSGGRLVCGDRASVDALAPYLTRTMPREKWSSDVHLEVRPEPVRATFQEFQSTMSGLARSFGSTSGSIHDFLDAVLGELTDLVEDVQKLSIDAQVDDSGIVATTRLEFQSNRSLYSRVVTTNRGDSLPASFWHLPGDVDTALFGRGSDPKLFEHSRELLSNMVLTVADEAAIPEPERKALKELVVDRMLALVTGGTSVYAMGFDMAAVEKAKSALETVKPDDIAARDAKRLALVEQVVGWHLYQVSEPVAKVGPMLKDWSALWNRPTFAKWVHSKSSKKAHAGVRIAPMPAGVTLPKETVHLEISIPREEGYSEASYRHSSVGPGPHGAAPPKPKTTSLKPELFHIFAVPDGAATWLAFGLDAKLVAQKASASLASAPDTNTLGKTARADALREGPSNGGGFGTLRGLMVFAALDDRSERSPFGMLGALPSKGTSPVIVSSHAEAPSAVAKGGASIGSLRVSRAVIEDIVKLVMSMR